MNLYMIKTVDTEDGSVNRVFVSANSYDDARRLVEDSVNRIIEVITDPQVMAMVIHNELSSVALIYNI